MEILIRIRQELTILFNLLYLLEVFSKYFSCVCCSNPTRCFFDDLLDNTILDDFSDIDLIMSLLEDTVLTCIFDLHVVKELEPKVF